MSTYFGDMLTTIADRGRALLERAGAEFTRERRPRAAGQVDDIVARCEALLSGRGEASGVARAADVLARYKDLAEPVRIAIFEALLERFGPDRAKLDAAITRYRQSGSEADAAAIARPAEPRRQELFRRLNQAPGGTAALVAMRADLLQALKRRPELKPVDDDIGHLLSSWFNRGFLVIRRIDWASPATVLENIIRYEAVHPIANFEALRDRLDPADRRLYAFFHPRLVDDPLIFVEVALTTAIPSAIAPLLTAKRTIVKPQEATTAVFYSISNTQRGLAGVSFGHFLIKQVVEELKRDLPHLSTFVTLSPLPGFAAWLAAERKAEAPEILTPEEIKSLAILDGESAPDPAAIEALSPLLAQCAAHYLLRVKDRNGRPRDPVARFHLGNGARLERINPAGDLSAKGLREAAGVMVNYLYDLDAIEENHEAFAEQGTIAASNAVRKLLRKPNAAGARLPIETANATAPARRL